MYNLDFPEGFDYGLQQFNPFDAYPRDYPFEKMLIDFNVYGSIQIIPQYNFSRLKEIQYLTYQGGGYIFNPTVDVTHMQQGWGIHWIYNADSALDQKARYDIVVTGRPTYTNGIGTVKVTNLWYDYETNPDKFYLDKICSSDYIIPYGTVPVKVRALRDGQWMNGQLLNYNHTPMTYVGQGLYEAVIEQEARTRFNYAVDDGQYGASVNLTTDEAVVYFGDNSSMVHTYGGEAINDLVIQNDGWEYNSEVNGFANNTIADSNSTSVTIQVPASEITIVYGQDSEERYDYATVYNSSDAVIVDFKAKKGDDFTQNLSSADGIFKFTYKKDGSGSNGKDKFWIKSITFTELPPYPEN